MGPINCDELGGGTILKKNMPSVRCIVLSVVRYCWMETVYMIDDDIIEDK